MISKIMYDDNDRDMVVMQHNCIFINANDNREMIVSRLLDFGAFSTDTAVARK